MAKKAEKYYTKEAQQLAKRWNIGIKRAYETIMKRIDKGLPPLPDCCKKEKAPAPSRRLVSEVKEIGFDAKEAKKLLEKMIEDDIGTAVAGEHYDLPKPIKESIELIEILMERHNIPRVPAFMISQALRYIMRVGVKTPDWGKDIGKAENYLHRALTGKWIKK